MPQRYIGYARSRLDEAGERYRNIPASEFEANRGELAKIASLIWDAVIDVLSAMALLDGMTLSGRSTELVRYAKQGLGDAISARLWAPAKLHNFQHKPDQTEPDFREACYFTGILLQLLNDRLPVALQLPVPSRNWLSLPPPQ